MPPPLPLPHIFANNPYLAAVGLWSAFIWAPILNFWNRFEAFLFPVDYFIHAAGEGQPHASLGIAAVPEEAKPPQAGQSPQIIAGEDVPSTPPAALKLLRHLKRSSHLSGADVSKLPVAGAAASPGVGLPPAYTALLAQHGRMDLDGWSCKLESTGRKLWGHNGLDETLSMLSFIFYVVCGYIFLLFLNRLLFPRQPRTPQRSTTNHRREANGHTDEVDRSLDVEKQALTTPPFAPNTPSDAFITTSDEDSSDISYAMSTCGSDYLEDEEIFGVEPEVFEDGTVAEIILDQGERDRDTESDESVESTTLQDFLKKAGGQLNALHGVSLPCPCVKVVCQTTELHEVLLSCTSACSARSYTEEDIGSEDEIRRSNRKQPLALPPAPAYAPHTTPSSSAAATLSSIPAPLRRPYRFFDDNQATPGPGPTTMAYRSDLAARALHVVPARSVSACTRTSAYVPRQKLIAVRKGKPKKVVEETEEEKRKRAKGEEKKKAKMARRAAKKGSGAVSSAAVGALPKPVSLV